MTPIVPVRIPPSVPAAPALVSFLLVSRKTHHQCPFYATAGVWCLGRRGVTVLRVGTMTKTLAAGALVAATALSVLACGGSSPSSPTTPSGTTSSSHNAGRNCLSCHSFTAAGTAYKSDGTTAYAGAIVRLTTASGGGGTVVAALTADTSGNFYTSSVINFGTGLYATATGTGGAVTPMGPAITSGACNNCHTSGNRIKVG